MNDWIVLRYIRAFECNGKKPQTPPQRCILNCKKAGYKGGHCSPRLNYTQCKCLGRPVRKKVSH